MSEPRPTHAPGSWNAEKSLTRAAIVEGSILGYRTRLDEAIRLIGHGARSGLVVQLTGLEKTTVARLFREIKNTSPGPGQSPYSDTWYLRDQWRLAHASLVWRVHRKLRLSALSDAGLVIKTFEAYCMLVREPLLDLTRAAFVPQLVANGTWIESRCADCNTRFLTPVEDGQTICPGCYLYYRHRCSQCNTPTRRDAADHFPRWCRVCGAHRVNGVWNASSDATTSGRS